MGVSAIEIPVVSTDEWIDRRMSRPLARGVVRLLAVTPVTANQVTVAAGLLGVAAGVALAVGTKASVLCAAAAMVGVLVLDCADGQLARLRGGGSRFGRVLDGLCDYTTAIAVHIGAIVFLARTGHDAFPALPGPVEAVVVVVSGLLLGVRAGIYDDLKGRYRGQAGGADERDEPETIRREIAGEPRRRVRAMLRAYLLYCRLQEPARRRSERGDADPVSTARALRIWSYLGPSTHLALLAGTCILAARWPDALRWYFLVSAGPAAVLTLLLLPLSRR